MSQSTGSRERDDFEPLVSEDLDDRASSLGAVELRAEQGHACGVMTVRYARSCGALWFRSSMPIACDVGHPGGSSSHRLSPRGGTGAFVSL
jgi:hypothetical protein